MTTPIPVHVVEPWVRSNGDRHRAGAFLSIPVEEFRAAYGLGYVAREFVPVFGPRVGRRYLQAVTPSGLMLGAPRGADAPILLVDVPYDVVAPSPAAKPVVRRPARVFPVGVNPSAPPTARRGCGCGGSRRV